MAEFILEIFGEEIPALMQKNAAHNFNKIATDILTKNKLDLKHSDVKTYISPRRISLYINNLLQSQEVSSTRITGPKLDANKKAIEGFLRSNGLDDVSQLEKLQNTPKPCYVYVKKAYHIETSKIIEDSIPHILQKMINIWPKTMLWDLEDGSQAKWIRPIRNIAAVFGKEVINVEFAGLKSNNLTFGHSSVTKEPLKIVNALHYLDILRDNKVIIDQEERKEKIFAQIRKLKFDLALNFVDDENSAIFDEICGLCEWPESLVASIGQKFMDLPEEILILTLKLNQRYLCLKDSKGNLSSNFIFVSNAIISDQNKDKIIKDNEKLVKARLSDSEFFINEDVKMSLDERVQGLKSIIFHKKLGSIYQKSQRISTISKFVSVFVPHCDLSLVERSAQLCKADLTSKAVAELPELQGKIGGFYAKKQKEDEKVIDAICEHYLPLGPYSKAPKTALGIVLSVADKIDSIAGFFLANEKPTSSKDPYGLRRAALGIIRIGITNNMAFPIRILVEKSLNAYPRKLLKELLGKDDEKFLKAKRDLVEEINIFFVERLKSYLKDNECLKHDVVNAVVKEYLSDIEKHKYCDIVYLANKIKFLDKFIKDEKNQRIIELYKRSTNILSIEEKKDKKKYKGKPSLLGMKSKYEKDLYKRIKQIQSDFKKFVIKGEFGAAFKLLYVLEAPLSQFFDNVVVNEKDKGLRENRLLILSKIRSLFNLVADLSDVEM